MHASTKCSVKKDKLIEIEKSGNEAGDSDKRSATRQEGTLRRLEYLHGVQYFDLCIILYKITYFVLLGSFKAVRSVPFYMKLQLYYSN